MSSYLEIKKNDTVLCSFSRNSDEYQAFNKYSEDWKQLYESDLTSTYQELKERVSTAKSNIVKYRMIIDKLSKADELMETLDRLNDWEEDVDNLQESLGRVSLLLSIFGEMDDEDKMYWRIC